MDEHAKGVQQSIESIIGADTVLKRRKKTEDDISKDTFEKIIITLEQANVRSSVPREVIACVVALRTDSEWLFQPFAST